MATRDDRRIRGPLRRFEQVPRCVVQRGLAGRRPAPICTRHNWSLSMPKLVTALRRLDLARVSVRIRNV
jgi:hypothetical protein